MRLLSLVCLGLIYRAASFSMSRNYRRILGRVILRASQYAADIPIPPEALLKIKDETALRFYQHITFS